MEVLFKNVHKVLFHESQYRKWIELCIGLRSVFKSGEWYTLIFSICIELKTENVYIRLKNQANLDFI